MCFTQGSLVTSRCPELLIRVKTLKYDGLKLPPNGIILAEVGVKEVFNYTAHYNATCLMSLKLAGLSKTVTSDYNLAEVVEFEVTIFNNDNLLANRPSCHKLLPLFKFGGSNFELSHPSGNALLTSDKLTTWHLEINPRIYISNIDLIATTHYRLLLCIT